MIVETINIAHGEMVFLPHIPLIPYVIPFESKRLQYPLTVCFSIKINESQRQTFKIAGVGLRQGCFSHRQF